MLTKKKPTDNLFVEGMDLKKWVTNSFPNQSEEVVDKSLLNNNKTINAEEDKTLMCLNQLLRLGLLCTQQSPQERPNMMDIVCALQSIRDTFLDPQKSNFSQISYERFVGCSSTSGNHDGNCTTSNGESSTF